MKRQKRKYIVAIAAVCVAALLLSACGGEDNSSGVSSAAASGSQEETGSGNREGSTEQSGSSADNDAEAEREEPTSTPEPVIRDMHDELEAELEEKVRALYEQRLLLHEAVRNIVAEEIEKTSFVTVNPKEQFSVTEVLIDEATGNPVVSEGVKEFLQAAAEGKSIQDMCQAALEGSVAQIPDYLAGTMEGSLQDVVTSLIGIDVFTPISTISQWMNPDQEPTALLQGIVEEQQKDVSALLLFMQQEEISAGDIYKVSQMVQAVGLRTQEIAAAQGNSREYVGRVFTLSELGDQYADTEAQLAAYGEMLLPDTMLEYDEEEKKRVGGLQAEVSEKLKQYEALCSFSIGNISANYDVEGFREAQKTASQAGLLGGTLFGDLVGGLMTESEQVFNGQIQENRRAFCDLLTDFMEESYVETVTAREAFMKQYNILLHMSEAADKDLYFADIYLENHTWAADLEETVKAYLTALSRYAADLDSANILYNCILTTQQTNYLFDLQIEIDSIYEVLNAVDPMWYEYGYSDDELTERWNRLVDSYVESFNFLVERRATMGQAPGFRSNGTGKYNGTEYHVYTKEFTAESRPVLILGGGRSYFYDMNGYLICMDAENARITARSIYPMSYLSKTEGAELKTYWNNPDSPEIAQMYEQVEKAQELYAYFWKSE